MPIFSIWPSGVDPLPNLRYAECGSVTLSIYFLAVQTHHDGSSDRRLIIAALAYLLILNGLELWYAMTYGYPQVRATIGLPCFIAGVLLAWHVIVHERHNCAIQLAGMPRSIPKALGGWKSDSMDNRHNRERSRPSRWCSSVGQFAGYGCAKRSLSNSESRRFPSRIALSASTRSKSRPAALRIGWFESRKGISR